MKLLIIRHGQSENNLLHATTGSYDGRSPDPEMTDLGHQQAQLLADSMTVMAQPAPDVLYSSLMVRAVQTAVPIANTLDIPIYGHMDAYECGGPYVGVPHDPQPHPGASRETLQALSERLILPDEVDESGWYRGSTESMVERGRRGHKVITDLRKQYSGQDITIGIVCHEMIAQYLIRSSLGFETSDGSVEPWLSLNNTGTTYIDFEQPVPVTETEHSGHEIERVLAWHNNCVHLDADHISG